MYTFEWLIWSDEHRAWWKPNENGYTENIREAGRYAFEDACRIVFDANKYRGVLMRPNEAMVRDESKCCRAPMVNGGAQCEACGSNGL